MLRMLFDSCWLVSSGPVCARHRRRRRWLKFPLQFVALTSVVALGADREHHPRPGGPENICGVARLALLDTALWWHVHRRLSWKRMAPFGSTPVNGGHSGAGAAMPRSAVGCRHSRQSAVSRRADVMPPVSGRGWPKIGVGHPRGCGSRHAGRCRHHLRAVADRDTIDARRVHRISGAISSPGVEELTVQSDGLWSVRPCHPGTRRHPPRPTPKSLLLRDAACRASTVMPHLVRPSARLLQLPAMLPLPVASQPMIASKAMRRHAGTRGAPGQLTCPWVLSPGCSGSGSEPARR